MNRIRTIIFVLILCVSLFAVLSPAQAAPLANGKLPLQTNIPDISPLVLLPGIGMILVALGFIVLAGVRKLGWGYLALGAAGWIVTVGLKFLWGNLANSAIYQGLQGAFPERFASLVFYLYVGLLTGVFEVSLIWIIVRYTKLGDVSWKRMLAFGIGFGALEALLIGLSSLANGITALTIPSALPAASLEQLTLTSNPLFGLAPVWERFFTILIHIFSSLLLFFGARQLQSRWFWIAFVYKTLLDAVAVFGQFWGLNNLGRLWAIEGFIFIWGLMGILGIQILGFRSSELEKAS